ncbi:MAG: UbiA family prenyltransferase [candidate division KSB1 bacterium]|nr:UbiA family prenyltransferase [candidate division KSB1 bacterium]MDZ7303549.1 UbiA family prenyltransferase [candidate division KSB1 bacterium]MDZ7312792.1 UbiA family prenyltransferase [candidate division KSB1 bacterium]
MNRIVKFFDYVFVLRPTLFFPVWTVYAAGYFAFYKFSGFGGNGAAFTLDGAALCLLGLLTLLMGSAYILNQLCDIETDRRNQKLFLIADGHISTRAAWLEMILLCVLPMSAGFLYGVATGGLLMAIFLLTGIFYNVAPFQWKGRPLLGLLANALGALFIFTAGWWSMRIEWRLPILHALPYMFAVSAVYLYTTLLDMEGDASTQKMTFGVRYGLRVTTVVGCILEFGALITAWWLSDFVIFYPALIAAPFFLFAVIRQRLSEVSRAIKLPILFLALAICTKVWQYFLLIAFVFFFSRWYYRRRFGLSYPSLAAK